MLDRIRSFLTVLEEGSLNRAAKRLGIAQPTLSRQIQSLEQEIGGPLFDRETSGMRPTDLGFRTRDLLRPVLQQYDLAWDELRNYSGGSPNSLRVGYLGLSAARFLNPALAALKQEFPELKLLLFDLVPAEQLQMLHDGKLDIAIIGEEVGSREEGFYKRSARELGILAIVAQAHPLATRKSIRLADLKNEYFIGVGEEAIPGRNAWNERLCKKAGFKPRFSSNTTDVSETFTRVASEGAVALIPDYVVGNPPPGITYLPVVDDWATWKLLVLRQRGKGTHASRKLFDILGKE